MAHHNSTPQTVLDAPSVTKEFVEGTEFLGANRAQLRRHGHLGDPRPKKFSGTLKGVKHWLREVLEQKEKDGSISTTDSDTGSTK